MKIPKHKSFQDLTNQIFGKLFVTLYKGRIGSNNQWLCVCECGNECIVAGGNLKSGHTQSCGCWHKIQTSKATSKHKMSKSSEYRTWANMKGRCYDKNNNRFIHYGGRGIRVCERWLNSFDNFYQDLGDKPSEYHSIERKNNNGNYEPTNCRWATNKEQADNKQNTIFITINGKTKTLQSWANDNNINGTLILSRLRSGITGKELIQPSKRDGNKLTFRGITDTYAGWSKRTGIKHETISQRIRRDNLSIEETLTRGSKSWKP